MYSSRKEICSGKIGPRENMIEEKEITDNGFADNGIGNGYHRSV